MLENSKKTKFHKCIGIKESFPFGTDNKMRKRKYNFYSQMYW